MFVNRINQSASYTLMCTVRFTIIWNYTILKPLNEDFTMSHGFTNIFLELELVSGSDTNNLACNGRMTMV